MTDLLVTGGHVVDPQGPIDATQDVLIRDGTVAAVGANLRANGVQVVDASGLTVAPGFVNLHCHLRDPGYEYKETIRTGTLAAARGGFTTVCSMPNTDPPVDSRPAVEYVLRTAAHDGVVRVLPVGCVTKGRAGRELAELAELGEAGCVAFSDDGSPVPDGAILRRALEYARISGLPIVDHCEDLALSGTGVMHEGWVSTRLGLGGQPAAAEESFVARDIALSALLNAPLHIAHVSTTRSLELIREAKERGVPVTAEVTPHHLVLSHHAVAFSQGVKDQLAYNSNAKVNPPLRTRDDVTACQEALESGTIDCIATDHAPHAAFEKDVEFDEAPFGISGLETAFGVCMTLVESGAMNLSDLIERLTVGPVRALRLDRAVPGLGSLAIGAPGDLVLIDPAASWTVEPERFASKGKNTPLAGRTLKGRIVTTVAGGRVVWDGEGSHDE